MSIFFIASASVSANYNEKIFNFWLKTIKYYDSFKLINDIDYKINKIITLKSKKDKLKNNTFKIWFSQNWKNEEFDFDEKISEISLNKKKFNFTIISKGNYNYDDINVKIWIYNENIFDKIIIWDSLDDWIFFNKEGFWYALSLENDTLIISNKQYWKYWFNYLDYTKNYDKSRLSLLKDSKNLSNKYSYYLHNIGYSENDKFKKVKIFKYPKNKLYLVFFIDKNNNGIYEKWEIKKIKIKLLDKSNKDRISNFKIKYKSKKLEDNFKKINKIENNNKFQFYDKDKKIKDVLTTPWLQKEILISKKWDLQKVLAYTKNNKLYFWYFIFNKNSKRLEFYELDYSNKKIKFIDEYDVSFEFYDKDFFDNQEKDYYHKQNYFLKNWNLHFYIIKRQGDIYDNDYINIWYKYNLWSWEKPLEDNFFVWKDFFENEFKNPKSDEIIDFGYNSEIFYKKNKEDKYIELFRLNKNNGFWIIWSVQWLEDKNEIYFDNHWELLACIWKYNLKSNKLEKIVPEHEAKIPFPFIYKNKTYVVYIEWNKIKVAVEWE